MEPVTNEVNIARGDWRRLAAERTSKTRCVNGHQFTEENTFYCVNSDGFRRRRCRECSRAQARKQYRRSRLTA
jgi:hypothetical protein